MDIIELKDLARQELRDLLTCRYMPRGWNREANRTIDMKVVELHPVLEDALTTIGDRLLPRPSRDVLLGIHHRAQRPRLKESVTAMVQLLTQLPAVDQADACGVALLREQRLLMDKLRRPAEVAYAFYKEHAAAAREAGIDVTSVLDALQELQSDLTRRTRDIEDASTKAQSTLSGTR